MKTRATNKPAAVNPPSRPGPGPLSLPAARSEPLAPSDEQIRARAYEIFLARNGGPGDALADWVQAERELTGTRSAATR